MSTLVLVRHGQTAGFLTGVYRDLTPHGVAQGRRLGALWQAQGFVPSAVVVGPLERHQQTWQAISSEVSGWPEPTEDPRLAEHAGKEVFTHWLESGGAAPTDLPSGMEAFRGALEAWARGEVSVPGAEDYVTFETRALAALRDLTAGAAGERVVAITSAGVIGAHTASIFGGDAVTAVRLSFETLNTSVTRVRFGSGGLTLSSFNTVPHLASGGATVI